MRHLTAQRVCAIAEAALRILDERTMKAAKAYILYQCDNGALHTGHSSGVDFHALERVFQPVITAVRKNAFIARMETAVSNARVEMAEIQESARAEWVVKKASEKNLIISAAGAREALSLFNGDCEKTLKHVLKQTPSLATPNGEATPHTCRIQADAFRRLGDSALAFEWDKEAVRLEIVTIGGSRETANKFLNQFGLNDALTAFLENTRGSIRYFQRSYERTKEEMEIAGASIEALTSEATKPHQLEAFETARERHRIARIDLINNARRFSQCHDPGIEKIFNAAASGDYLPHDLEQRLIAYCLQLSESA